MAKNRKLRTGGNNNSNNNNNNALQTEFASETGSSNACGTGASGKNANRSSNR
jgi:hypothetical protein